MSTEEPANKRPRIKISLKKSNPPPILVRLSFDSLPEEPSFGLAAVGPLPDVHEAALTVRGSQEYLSRANPFAPQRNAFEQWQQNPGGGTAFSPTISSLWPVLPGTWLVGRLTWNEDTCGAVFWNEAAVGLSVEQAAQRIQRDICVEGNVGEYNVNKEPPEFEQRGGRLVGRYTWDNVCHGLLNKDLEKDSPLKLDLEEYEKMDLGPELMLTPALSFLDQAWPTIKPQPAYGLEFGGSGKGRLLSNAESEHDGFASYARIYLPNQEYLAGRILTTTVHTKAGETRQAAHMLMVFTYSAPEQLEDAGVEGFPISGEKAAPLKTCESFQSFLMNPELSDDDLKDALGSVSARKVLDLLKFVELRSDAQDRAQMAQRLVSTLYATPIASAPSMQSLFDTIAEFWDRIILDAIVVSLDQTGALRDLVQTAQTNYDAAGEDACFGYPHNPSVLLERANSVQGAEALIRAGVALTPDAVSGNMARPDLYETLVDKLLEISDAGTHDELLSDLSVQAARGLYEAPLEYTLSKLSSGGRMALFSSEDFPIFGPIDSRPPPRPGSPPVSKGSIGQNAAGKFIQKYYDHLNYLVMKEKAEEQNRLAELRGYGGRTHVSEREDYRGEDFIGTVRIMEKYRPGVFSKRFYEPQEDFGAELTYRKRIDNSPTAELLPKTKLQLSQLLDNNFASGEEAEEKS